MSLTVPIVRITLAGSVGSGKSRLADSFVNSREYVDEYNSFPTKDLELFYRVVNLGEDEFSRQERFQQNSCVIVEMEDTPGSKLIELREMVQQNPALALPPTQQYETAQNSSNTDQILRDLDRQRISQFDQMRIATPSAKFLDMKRAQPLILPPELARSTPFAIFPHPYFSVQEKLMGPRFLTQGRMGFFLVFDLCDLSSVQEAIEIHLLLLWLKQQSKTLMPIVFLIGNKEDLVGGGDLDEESAVLKMAEKHASQHELQLYKVSAATGKGVYKAFNEMTLQIAQNPALAAFEIEVFGGVKDNEEAEDDEQ